MAIPSAAKLAATVGLAFVLAFSACAQAPAPAPTTAAPATGTTAAPAAAPTAAQPASPVTTAAAPASAVPPAAAATAAPKPVPVVQSGDLKAALTTLSTQILNPILSGASGVATVGAPMYDSQISNSGGPDLKPEVVEKWEMSADGLSWTYYIRNGVKFHNGDDLTADDVKFTIEQGMKPDAYHAETRNSVERVEKVDTYTVRIFTKGVQPYFPWNSVIGYQPSHGGVLPKSYFEKVGAEAYEKQPVGSGPWKFLKSVPGDMVQWEALPSHWRQTPSFKTYSAIQMPEEATRIAALKSGQVQFIDVGIEQAGDLEKAGYQIFSQNIWPALVLLPGAYDPRGKGLPTADVRVRKALSLAINRADIIKSLYLGKANPAFVGSLSYAAADIDLAFWKAQAEKINRYDPTEAKQLLRDAGYPNGFEFKFWTAPFRGVSSLPQLAQVIQSYWAQIGVKAQIIPVDSNAINAIVNSQKSAEAVGHAMTYRTGSNPLTGRALDTYYGSGQFYGMVHKAMPDFDGLMKVAYTDRDAAKRKEALAKALEMIGETYTVIQVAQVPEMGALSPKVDVKVPSPLLSFGRIAAEAKPR